MSESSVFAIDQYVKTLSEKELKRLTELSSQSEFQVGSKRFLYNMITVRQWHELEKLRSAWERENAKRGQPDFDPDRPKEAFLRIYVKAAEYYLGISEAEFEGLPWPILQLTIDACNFRTLHGSAFL
jgi:hypothetical protein